MATKTRRFGMHQNLLYDVIMKQAGTLQKAILEGVMNAIDAGATRCIIELDTHRFSIEDDGHGFQSFQEIEDFFEQFGTPHKEGDATYGRFRMGRGQMMAFGLNTWRSRVFEMRVDVKNRGLDYDLTEHDEDFPGTKVDVELYSAILPSDLERMKEELKQFVAWAQIPVILNGDTISTHPSEAKWDFEDDTAYYKLSSSRNQLAIYNLGVLVNSFWAGRFGMGGTVVSKKQLEVNFARNDIMSSCPNGQKISAHIRKLASKGAAKKTKLTDAERNLLVRDFLSGEIAPGAAAKLRCITDVNGRNWPIDKILQIPQKFGNRLIHGARGDQMIETAQRRDLAFSVDDTTLERFGVRDCAALLNVISQSAKRLLDKTTARGDYSANHILSALVGLSDTIEVIDRDELRPFISSDHIALSEKELTPTDTVLLRSLEKGFETLIKMLNRARYEDRIFLRRKIRLGKSDTALAWTDGKDSIWVDVAHARLLRRGYPGAYQIASTLLHEMLHEGPDTGTHEHDFAFYQAFHDMSSLEIDPVGAAADQMVWTFIAKLKQSKKKLSQNLLKRDDSDLMIDQIKAELAEDDIDA